MPNGLIKVMDRQNFVFLCLFSCLLLVCGEYACEGQRTTFIIIYVFVKDFCLPSPPPRHRLSFPSLSPNQLSRQPDSLYITDNREQLYGTDTFLPIRGSNPDCQASLSWYVVWQVPLPAQC